MRKISVLSILALTAAFDASAACNVNAMNGVWTTSSAAFVGEAHAGNCFLSIKNGAMSGTCLMQHPTTSGGDVSVNASGPVTLIGATVSDPGNNDDGFKVCQLQMVANYTTGGASTWTLALGNGGRAFTGHWTTPWGTEGVVTGIKQ